MRWMCLIAVVLASACASTPKLGADMGACQVSPTIVYKSENARVRVCTPGDTATWRKVFVHYSVHNEYGRDTDASGDFYAAPGQECVNMPKGLIPTASDSCERYTSP